MVGKWQFIVIPTKIFFIKLAERRKEKVMTPEEREEWTRYWKVRAPWLFNTGYTPERMKVIERDK